VSNPWDEPKQSPPVGPWLVIVAVVAFGLGSYLNPSWFYGQRDDDQEQVDPTPAKLEKGSHVLVVEETELRKNFPHIATIQSDRDYWDKLKASGINWHFYDSHSPSVASYEADIKAAGLPALLVISPAGRVLLSKSLPPTTESIDEALRSLK
jgi:hypothetical protein